MFESQLQDESLSALLSLAAPTIWPPIFTFSIVGVRLSRSCEVSIYHEEIGGKMSLTRDDNAGTIVRKHVRLQPSRES